MSILAARSEASPRSTSTAQQLKISPKLRHALQLMIEEGKRIDHAAEEAGISTRDLRLAFERPHVVKWARARKKMLIASMSPRALHRMVELSETSSGMAAVKATENILLLDEDTAAAQQATSSDHGPGVTIIIQAATPALPHSAGRSQTIDVTAVLPDGKAGED